MAKESAVLGVKLFVMDDGWFGKDYPRVSDSAGLGDWVPNPERFPNGLDSLVNDITALRVTNSEKFRFGIWVEPDMVNPNQTSTAHTLIGFSPQGPTPVLSYGTSSF
jgi:alpha-galactosidase